MRLLKWVVLTWCCLSLITSAVIGIGRGQPPSDGLALLHLDECELPCWLGITPGQTPWDAAKQMIMDAYSDAQYSVHLVDASHIDVSVNGTDDVLSIEIAPLSFNYADSPVNRIELTMKFAYLGRRWVSIGDLIASVGSPADMIMSDIGPSLLLKESRVHVRSAPYIGCNMVLTRLFTTSIFIHKRPDEYPFVSAPSRWRGFNRCYKLR